MEEHKKYIEEVFSNRISKLTDDIEESEANIGHLKDNIELEKENIKKYKAELKYLKSINK